MFNKLFFATLICSVFSFSSCEEEEKPFQPRDLWSWTPEGNILLVTTTSPSTCDYIEHLKCDSMEYFDVKALAPPYLYLNFFCPNDDMKVRVPAESLDAYRNAEVWRSLNIEALPD